MDHIPQNSGFSLGLDNLEPQEEVRDRGESARDQSICLISPLTASQQGYHELIVSLNKVQCSFQDG